MAYRVVVSPGAQKELRAIRDERIASRLRAAMRQLASDARPRGSLKLKGAEMWRVRVGDYRILYQISDEPGVVRVVAVRHRRHAYQG